MGPRILTAAALAPLLVGLSGCILADDEPLTIYIPPLLPGAAWTYTDGKGLSTQTSTLGTEPEIVRDMFGDEVLAWVLRGQSNFTALNGTRVSHETLSAFEAGNGSWIVRQGGYGDSDFYCQSPRSSSGGPAGGPHASFPRAPIRYDNGALTGTLREGDVVERTSRYESYGTIYETRLTYRALSHMLLDTTAFGEQRKVTAMNVEVDAQAIRDGQVVGDPHTTRQWYTDGVHMPLRVYNGPNPGSASDRALQRELVAYTFGGGSIDLAGELSTHQFETRHPDAEYDVLRGGFDDRELGLEFPQAEALAALGRDPRGVLGHLWLQEHPDAVAFLGSYERDPEAGVYEWEWWFEDQDQLLVANARREPLGPMAAAIDSASSSVTVFQAGQPPGEAEPTLEVVSLARAFEVASAFAAIDDWRLLEWQVPARIFSGGHHGQPAWVAFLPLTSERRQPAGPFEEAIEQLHGPAPAIDMVAGGVAMSSFAQHECSVESTLPGGPLPPRT